MRVIYLLGVLSLITEVASGQNHLMGARLGISGAGNTVGSDTFLVATKVNRYTSIPKAGNASPL